MSRRPLPLAALALLLALPAGAQAPEGGGGAGTDPAVGRLNHAGFRTRMHCSAALVAPREAVTALHCVEGVEAGDLHLLLGYDRGEYVEHRRVVSVVASAEADVARLCLDAASAVPPLPASAEPPEGGPATVRGYPRTLAHAQEERDCPLRPIAGQPLAWLGCGLEQGLSGAPVRAGGGSGPVVGVASASAEWEAIAALLSALPEGGCEAPG